ncbi:HAD family hydrolase [Streptomyces sp. NPDC049577]|uniref:HAD family hydrolase n=1 Tax=Streptomyces sp. NPDC049577 TaxID=3155153 RepID=UPI00343FE0BF
MTNGTARPLGEFDAVLLDMDGTIVNSDAVVERCWRRWAGEHGLDADEVMKVVHGRQGHATMAVLLPGRPMELNHADNRRMLEAETADMDGVVPVPGAPAFMAALARLPHALVTSADRKLAEARMGAAGMYVVGVGPRAAAHAPDAHVTDLTRIRVEAGADGGIVLSVLG